MVRHRSYLQPLLIPRYAPSESSATSQPFETPRVLYIHHLGLTRRRAHILDSDKRTVLYRIRANRVGLFSSKPHIIVHSGVTHRVIGTVRFHRMSTVIDLELHHRTILLLKLGSFTTAHRFESPASRSLLKWRRDGPSSGADLVCIDRQQVQIARFERSKRARRKDGKFMISPGVEGRWLDEVVVSGLAMAQYHKNQEDRAAAPMYYPIPPPPPLPLAS